MEYRGEPFRNLTVYSSVNNTSQYKNNDKWLACWLLDQGPVFCDSCPLDSIE